MGKRGRPRKNGVKPGWMLHRVCIALHGYDQARSAGEKHSVAVTAAVEAVRGTFPKMKGSETEVRRILAEYRSKRLAETLLITKIAKRLTVKFGVLPEYPRVNAVAKS